MNHRASTLGRGYDDPDLDPRPVRFRRAVALVVMTFLVPGSAQLFRGNKWVGRVAVLVWLVAIAAVAYLGYVALTDRSRLIDLTTDPDRLRIVRFVLVAGALGWLALMIDAWRLGSPFRLGPGRATVVTVVCAALVVGTLGSAAYVARLLHASQDTVEEVFADAEATATVPPLKGRFNILLLGSDSGSDRTGLRPDSMTIASIDASTGKTVLISLPRNLQNVPFPDDSPMKKVYPYGFNCGSECLLNAVHTIGADRKDLYPGAEDPGMEAQIDAIEGASGLRINYYVMINMKGFSSLVDALGGVTMDVKTRIAMFGHDDAWKQEYIEPGRQKLNGREALWYSRSRVQSDDYTRMGRQKCMMQAMLTELSPQKVLLNAIDILASGKQLIATTIPRQELGQFADLALKSRSQKTSTLSLVPPKIDVVTPDFDEIHQLVEDAIKDSEKPRAAKPSASATTTSPSPSATVPGAEPTDDSPKVANETDDLASAC